MPNVTISVSKELKAEMDAFPEMNWSGVARKAFEQQVRDLKFLQEFTKDSTLTEEDAIRLGRELKARQHKRIHESRR